MVNYIKSHFFNSNLSTTCFLFFFADEISMVSNSRLTQIHLRLEQIFNQCGIEKKAFAGVNMLLLGDLLQVYRDFIVVTNTTNLI